MKMKGVTVDEKGKKGKNELPVSLRRVE